MGLVCKICIAQKGIKGSEIAERSFNSHDDFVEHLKTEHDITVIDDKTEINGKS